MANRNSILDSLKKLEGGSGKKTASSPQKTTSPEEALRGSLLQTQDRGFAGASALERYKRDLAALNQSLSIPDKQKAYDNAVYDAGLTGWWRRYKEAVLADNEKRTAATTVKGIDYSGWVTDDLTAANVYGTDYSSLPSLEEAFQMWKGRRAQQKAEEEARRQRRTEAYKTLEDAKASEANSGYSLYRAAVEENGGSARLLFYNMDQEIAAAERRGDTERADALKTLRGQYQQEYDYEQANNERRQLIAEWDATQVGDTQFRGYRGMVDEMGEDKAAQIAGQYRQMQEWAGDGYGRKNGLSVEEQEDNRQRLEQFEKQYADFLKLYGVYGLDTRLQGDAGVKEAEAARDEAMDAYKGLTEGATYSSSIPDETAYQLRIKEIEDAYWDGEIDEAEKERLEEEALQQLQAAGNGGIVYKDATDEEVMAAAKAVQDAEETLRHAQEVKDRAAAGAVGYDGKATEQAIAGLEAWQQQQEELGPFRSQDAKDEFEQKMADQREFYRGLGMSDEEMEPWLIADEELFMRQYGNDQANARRYDLEYNPEFAQPDMDKWTEEEKRLFGYYFNPETGGSPERAAQYAMEVNTRYKQEEAYQRELETAERATRDFISGALASIESVPKNLLGGLFDFAKMQAEYVDRGGLYETPLEGWSRDSEVIRSSIGENLNDKWGVLDEDIPVIGGKGVGDAYQLGMSVLDSFASRVLSGGRFLSGGGYLNEAASAALTNTMFFGSAASSTAREAKARGLDDRHALLTAFGAGLAEGIGETLSIEALFGEGGVKAIKKGLLYTMGRQGFFEMSEEGVTTMLNWWWDDLVNGDHSEYATKIRGYEAAGVKPKDARKKANADRCKQIAFDLFGGLVSGGISAGVHTGAAVIGDNVETRAYGAQADQQAMFDYAALLDGQNAADENLRSLAGSYRGRYESKGSLSNLQAGRMQQAILDSLRGNIGVPQDTLERIGERIRKYFDSVSDAREAVENIQNADEKTRKKVMDLARDLGAKLNQPGLQRTSKAQRAAARVQQALDAIPREETRRTAGEERAETQGPAARQEEARFGQTGRESVPEVSEEAYRARKDAMDSVELKDGSRAEVAGLEYDEESGTLLLRTRESKDAGERLMPLEQAELTDGQAELIGTLQDVLGPEQAAHAFNVMGREQDAGSFAKAYALVRNVFGRAGANMEQAAKSTLAKGLSEAQFEHAYLAGQQMRETLDSKQGRAFTGTGSVRFDGGTVDGLTLAPVTEDLSGLDVKLVEELARVSGVDIVFFQSEADENGNYRGDNGLYKDGTVYLDIHAGMNSTQEGIARRTLALTLSHEATHLIQQHAPAQYEQLRGYVATTLVGKMGADFQTLVEARMRQGLSYDAAVDEVVANACERVLLNASEARALRQANPTLFQTIRNYVLRLLHRMKARSAEAKAMEPLLDELTAIWQKGFREATDRSRAGEMEKKSAAREGDPIQFSAREEVRKMDIPWDPDNNSSIKTQLRRVVSDLIKKDPVARVTFNKKTDDYVQKLNDILNRNFGNKINREDGISFLFDKNAIAVLRHYIDTDGEKAAAIAAPYVLKRGEIISGHKNHKGDLYPSLTFAAAVELNGKKGVEAVSVLFADKDRVHSLRVLGPDGSNFVLPIMEETTPRMEGPGVKAPITRPIGVASVDSIRDSSEKSNNKVDEPIKRSRREGSRTDRELLLEAAEKKGADKAVKKYAEAVRAEERLEQKLEKQEQRLAELKEQSAGKPTVEQALDRAEKTEAAEKEAEAELAKAKKAFTPQMEEDAMRGEKYARALRNSVERAEARLKTAQDNNSAAWTALGWARSRAEERTKLEKEIGRTEEALRSAEEKADALEAGEAVQKAAEAAREAFWNKDMSKAARENRELRESNRRLQRDLDFYREQARFAKPEERRVSPEDVRRVAEDLLEEHGSRAPRAKLERALQAMGDHLVSSKGEKLNAGELNRMAGEAAETLLRGVYDEEGAARYSEEEIREMLPYVRDEISDAVMSRRVRQADTIAERRAKDALARAKRDADEAREKLRQERASREELVRRKVEQLKNRQEESRRIQSAKQNIERIRRKLSRELRENSAKHHIPEVMKKDIGKFLQSLDTLGPFAGEGRIQDYLDEMDAIRQIVAQQSKYLRESGETDGDGLVLDLPEELEEALQNHINKVRQAAKSDRSWKLSRMSLAELRELEEILTVINTSVNNANILLTEPGRFKTTAEAGEATIRELGEMRERVKTSFMADKLRRFIGWNNTTPFYAFKRMGEGGRAMFKSLTKGWGELAFKAQSIIKFAEGAYTAEEAKAWEKTTHEFELRRRLQDIGEGEAETERVMLSEAQIMELWCLWQREQAQHHLLGAGIELSELRRGAKNIRRAGNHLLSLEDMGPIFATLSERQKQVCRALQHYMNTTGRDWGNEVSIKRYGIRSFTEEHYWPIRTDSNSRDARTPESERGNLYRLLNQSFTKNTVKNANNAVVIGSVFDSFANHMADMAKYNALALPMLDTMRWFNYRTRSEYNEKGQFTTESVRLALEKAWGKEAAGYFQTLMQDLNGNEEAGRGEDVLRRLASNFKVASVGANLRVALQQPTSIVRAALVIDPQYLARGAAMKGGREKALQYSGLAVWKDLGYYDTSINRGLREKIKHTEGFGDKLREASMKLAEQGDRLTWAALWNACELETREKKGLKGEELMQATAERFDELIMATQVMDSTLTRSQNMRSRSGLMSEFTAFMAEPTLTFNTLMDVAVQIEAEARRSDAMTAAKKYAPDAARAALVFASSSAVTALFAAVGDAFRDDDEYETWLQKLTEHFLKNYKDNLDPTQLIPIVKDAVNILLRGNTKDMMATSTLEKVRQACEIWEETVKLEKDLLDKPTKTTSYGRMTLFGKIYKTLDAAGRLAGLPVAPAAREVQALWNAVAPPFGGKKFKTYDSGPEREIEDAYLGGYLDRERAQSLLIENGLAITEAEAGRKLWTWEQGDAGAYDAVKGAALRGDRDAFEKGCEQMRESGFEESEIQSAVRGAIRNRYQGTDESGRKLGKEEAIRAVQAYGGKKRDEAEALVQEWTCFVVTGMSYSKIGDYLLAGAVSEKRAAEMWQLYGGMSKEAAESKAAAALFKDEYAALLPDGKQATVAAALDRALANGGISAQRAQLIWRGLGPTWQKTYAEYKGSR